MPENLALWLPKPGTAFRTGSAPYPTPGPDEIVVRARAVAVNPIDGLPAPAYRLVLPWVRFPTVVGSDVAGEVVDVGDRVVRFAAGDRVVGHATSIERAHPDPRGGAFQHFPVLQQHMVSALPDEVTFEDAAVLPLALSTAGSGLFQQDQLALRLPTIDAPDRMEVVLVWGGSTSVGSNAIQLARNAGYSVVTTASPRNEEYVKALGAEASVDYRSRTAVDELATLIGDRPLAGTIAIGRGSLAPAIALASRLPGPRRVASAQPGPATILRARLARRRSVSVTSIWGGSLRGNEVGPAIYVDFLAPALASGSFRPAPRAETVGAGLDAIPAAIIRLKRGVSAVKLVITI